MVAVRRPVFWFLWPAPPPGPVDDDAEQVRWIRVCSRGPWRWGFLIAFTVLVTTVLAAAVSAALVSPGILTVVLTLVVALPLVALLARAWVAGTYVCDRGIKVSGVLITDVVPWDQVIAVRVDGRSRILGLPLPAGGERVVLDTSTRVVGTHVESRSPDLWLRPEAWDAARDRLFTWWAETR